MNHAGYGKGEINNKNELHHSMLISILTPPELISLKVYHGAEGRLIVEVEVNEKCLFHNNPIHFRLFIIYKALCICSIYFGG